MEVIGSEKDPLSWGEFEAQIRELRTELDRKRIEAPRYSVVTDWLFRGQSDWNWGLTTTLERFADDTKRFEPEGISVQRYLSSIQSILPAVNSLAQKKFKLDIRVPTFVLGGWTEESLKLLYYLRHHGYPTPLLDWSRSYLVSAFFAYQKANECQNVAIYAYNDTIDGAKAGWAGDPNIGVLGHYVETDKRHFLQQSEYTVCMSQLGDDKLVFSNHQEAASENFSKNRMKKYILAGSEKFKVLQILDEANVNAYSLYGSEEALMEMLAFRELRLD